MFQWRVARTASSSHPRTHTEIGARSRASRLRHNPWSVWTSFLEPAWFWRRRIFVSDVCIWSLCNRPASRCARQYVLSIFLGRGTAASAWELEVPYFPGRKGNIQGRRGFRRRRRDCTGWEAFPASPGGSHSDRSRHLRRYRHCMHTLADSDNTAWLLYF